MILLRSILVILKIILAFFLYQSLFVIITNLLFVTKQLAAHHQKWHSRT